MSKFEVGQVWVTRDGRKARIVATDSKDIAYPVVALVECEGVGEEVCTFDGSGRYDARAESSSDLIREHREPREVWVRFHKTGGVDDCDLCPYPDAVKFREVIE